MNHESTTSTPLDQQSIYITPYIWIKGHHRISESQHFGLPIGKLSLLVVCSAASPHCVIASIYINTANMGWYKQNDLLLARMVLLSFLVLFVSLADASQSLRSLVVEDRQLPAQNLPPPNDNCSGAIIVPSNFPGTTYTTAGVPIVSATQSSVPYHNCYLPGRTKDVWYQFTPSTTNFYSFSTNLGDAQMVIFTNPTMTSTCKNSRK